MRSLGHGEIIHQTLPLHLTILQHQEVSFHLIQSPAFPVILGFPWLLLDPGFANFYHKFVWNFSAVAAPLSALPKGKTYKFLWSSEPKEAFKELKRHFTTVPMLTLPDPNKPFVVEVDASDVGVGTILS